MYEVSSQKPTNTIMKLALSTLRKEDKSEHNDYISWPASVKAGVTEARLVNGHY